MKNKKTCAVTAFSDGVRGAMVGDAEQDARMWQKPEGIQGVFFIVAVVVNTSEIRARGCWGFEALLRADGEGGH